MQSAGWSSVDKRQGAEAKAEAGSEAGIGDEGAAGAGPGLFDGGSAGSVAAE